MIKHFLFILFTGLITFVIFINVCQYSGSIMPIETMPVDNPVDGPSFFGFSSILTFIQNIGNETQIQIGFNAMKAGFGIFQRLTIDQFLKALSDMQDAVRTYNWGKILITLLTNFVQIFCDCIILPFTLLFSIGSFLFGLVVFAISFLQIFAKFLLGAYNSPVLSSGIGESIPTILPNLLYVLRTSA